MLLFAVFLGLIALCASAMFSGSEIGFYRIPRIRLKLDALAGDRTARRFLWLANNPTFFVATVLVGNNIANNLISMASVLLVRELFPQYHGLVMEVGAAILLAPFLFLYGELFPKYIFLHAPNRFLRILSPILLFFFILFLPLTVLLWLLGRLIAMVMGKSRETIRLTLARTELRRTFDEGHEAGVLSSAQRRLADGVLAAASRKVRDMTVPLSQFPPLSQQVGLREALEWARTRRLDELPVFDGETPIGYVRALDVEILLRRAHSSSVRADVALPIRDFVEIDDDYSPLAALALLQSTHAPLGCVVERGRNVCIGILHRDRLRSVLLGDKK